MAYKHILLASFVPHDSVDEAFEKISSVAGVDKNRIFVFKVQSLDDYIFTYNIEADLANTKFSSIWQDTISIHRKKETNTLYTVNALNQIIKAVNNGVIDKTYQLDWSIYQNSFILTDEAGYRIIDLIFFKKISWK